MFVAPTNNSLHIVLAHQLSRPRRTVLPSSTQFFPFPCADGTSSRVLGSVVHSDRRRRALDEVTRSCQNLQSSLFDVLHAAANVRSSYNIFYSPPEASLVPVWSFVIELRLSVEL